MTRERIRARRQQLKLSQVKLAAQVGISAQAVMRFEGGHLSLSPTTIERICDALGLDVMERVRQHLSEVERLAAGVGA
jgi:transcriptional regulator with XRE-family HTH domain